MSEKRDPQFVPLQLCTERHETLAKEITRINEDVTVIKNALIGKDLRGGIVKDLQDMKGRIRGSLSGREKSAIIVALVTSISAIIVALIR
jgi:hypothetical protein